MPVKRDSRSVFDTVSTIDIRRKEIAVSAANATPRPCAPGIVTT
jgi:hypothetical protein